MCVFYMKLCFVFIDAVMGEEMGWHLLFFFNEPSVWHSLGGNQENQPKGFESQLELKRLPIPCELRVSAPGCENPAEGRASTCSGFLRSIVAL